MIKVCKYCGKEFDAYHNRVEYCSDECRKNGKYKVRCEWVQKSGYNQKRLKPPMNVVIK